MALLDHAESGDRSPRPERAFIPGIYNFCDRWCERCQFRHRCRVDADSNRAEEAADRVRAGNRASPNEVDLAWPTEAELAATARLINLSFERRSRHPISVLGREYLDATRGVSAALRPMLKESGDPVSLTALETVERLDMLIAVKVWRAVGSAIDRALFPDQDHDSARRDANGSAKLARLLIAESRGAWLVLAEPGRARADGVPMAMVARLDTLDTAVAREFPDAMAFVRPGFDEEGSAQ